MTDILRLFFIVLLLTISLSAYFLVIGALFPNRITKSQRVINQMPSRAFGVGFVNFLFFGVIALVLLTLTDGRVGEILRIILLIPTIAIFLLLGILFSFGLAGMANVIGERIFPDQTKLKQNILGVAILSIGCALPFAGWFLLLPFVGFVGIGAFILGLFQQETPAQ